MNVQNVEVFRGKIRPSVLVMMKGYFLYLCTRLLLALEIKPKVEEGSLLGNSKTALDYASGPAQSVRDLSFVTGVYSA